MTDKHPEATTEGEGFLGRWARLKREGESDPPAEEVAAAGPGEDAVGELEPMRADGDEAAAEPHEPVKTDADMPPIESIDEHSNIGDFFSSGVSRELRQAALRRLFHLPKYNFRDGLNDYDADYRTFVPLGDVVTADMRLRQERLEEMARRARDRLAASNDDDADAAESAPGARDEAPDVHAAAEPDTDTQADATDPETSRPDHHA
jgi:hypothetical protein